MRLLLAAVCTLALASAVGASTRGLSPERPLTSPVAALSQEVVYAAIASNGTMALASWVDYRSTLPQVFVARIDASGHVLDPLGIALTSSTLYEDNQTRVVPRVNGFLVGWTSRDVTSSTDRNVWLAPVEGNGLASSTKVATGKLLDLATNGATTVVLRSVPLNVAGDSDTFVTILDASLSPVSSTRVAKDVSPRIVATAYGFFLAWVDYASPGPRVAAMRLDSTGAAIDSQPILIASGAQYQSVAVAASGADAYTAITDSSKVAEIAHLGAGGMVTHTPIEASDGVAAIEVGADGSFTATLLSNRMPTLRTIDASGVTTAVTKLSTVTFSMALFASLGHRPYALLTENGRLLGGFAGDPLTAIAQAPHDQGRPAVASDGSHLLFVWAERYNYYSYAIVGVLTDLKGNALGPAVEIAPPRQYAPTPAVTFDGSEYVIVFQENREPNEALYQYLVARRVSRDGVVAASETILSKTANYKAQPRLASDGSSVMVAWFEGYYPVPAFAAAIYSASSFAASGSAILNGITVSPISGYSMDVAWNGQSYVLVAEQHDLTAYVVSSSGTLLATKAIVAGDPNSALTAGSHPTIAWGADRAMVAFESFPPTATSRIHGVFIDRNASPLGDAFAINDPAGDSDFFPHAAWDGSAFVVGWDRGDSFLGLGPSLAYGDAFAARVAPNATLPDVFVVAATSLDDDWPLPFASADGSAIVIYRRMTEESGGAHQLFTRQVTPPRPHVVRRP